MCSDITYWTFFFAWRDLFAKTMLQHNSLSAAGLLLMRWITIIHRRYYIFSVLKVESTNLLRQLHELHTTRVIRGSHYSFQKNGMIAVARLSFQQFAKDNIMRRIFIFKIVQKNKACSLEDLPFFRCVDIAIKVHCLLCCCRNILASLTNSKFPRQIW